MAKYQIGDTASNAKGEILVYTQSGWVPGGTPRARTAFEQQHPVAVPTPEPGLVPRYGRGLRDVVSGVRQATGLMPETGKTGSAWFPTESEEKESVALYERGRGPDAGVDWARIGGQATMTTPLAFTPGVGPMAAGASMAGRAAGGAALGSLAGASLFTENPTDRAINSAAGLAGGALGGAFVPPLLKAGAKAGSAVIRGTARAFKSLSPNARATVTQRVRDAVERGGLSLDELSEASRRALMDKAAKAFRGGNLDEDALVRQAKAEGFGFTDTKAPTRGQVTRDPTQYSDERNLAKLDAGGGPLRERFTNQRARIGEVVEETGERLGATGSEGPFDTGEVVEEAVQKQAAALQRKVAAKYKAAREAAPWANVAPDDLKASLGNVLQERRNSIPGDVRNRIRELLAKKEGIEPVELENLDKLLSDYYGADRATNAALDMIKTSVRGMMEDFSDSWGGAYKEAVGEASKRFAAIGDWKKMTGKLVSGTIEPDAVLPRVMRGPVRQVEKLKAFIEKASPETWGRLRAAAWNKIIDDSMKGDDFSEAAYNLAIKRIGKDRMRLLFGPEAQRLEDFGEVARMLLRPADHRINMSNTTPAGANMLRSMAGGIMDMATPGAGVAGRIITPLIDSGRAGAAAASQQAQVARALGGAPGGLPLTTVPPAVQGLIGRASRAAGPSAGLGLLGLEQ